MSDYFIEIIPEDPSYVLGEETIDRINCLTWFEDNVSIIVNETIQFADAGENFERVLCPFCKADLIDWWGGAMDESYSEEKGFTDLDTVTPCCNKETSLNELDYYFPQGFFTTMILMQEVIYQNTSQVPQELHLKEICQELFEVTNVKWRVLRVHI